MEIMHVKLIALFSFVCLCVRHGICQAPPSPNSQNKKPTGEQPALSNPCKDACPPAWINLLHMYSAMLTKNTMQPVCNIAIQEKFISACSATDVNRTCGKKQPGVKFCCCPALQLSKVKDCLKSDHICVPDSFNPWQKQLTQAFMGAMLQG